MVDAVDRGAASTMREEFLRLAEELATARRVGPERWPPVDVAIIIMVTSTIEPVSRWLLQQRPPSTEQMADIHEHPILTPAVKYKTVAARRPGQAAGRS
jgi:hypothetical protein